MSIAYHDRIAVVIRLPAVILLMLSIAGVASPGPFGAQSAASDVTVSNPRSNGDLVLTVFAASYLRPGSTASVLIGIEVHGLAATATDASRRLEISCLAEGSPGASPRVITVPLADRGAETQAVEDGVRVLVRVALPAGRHRLHVTVRDSAYGSAGSVVHELEVPNLVDASITMSNLVITSSSVRGLTQADSEEDLLLPLLVRPPAGRRRFVSTEQVEVDAEIYQAELNPADDFDTQLRIATSVLTPDGRVVYETVDSGASEMLSSGAYGYHHYTLVPIAKLPPGPYVLQVSASDGAAASYRSVPITVIDPRE